MIPSIETIVEDLLAENITKQQAIAWLHQHAADAASHLRHDFPAADLPCVYAEGGIYGPERAAQVAQYSYVIADAMLAERAKVEAQK